MIGNCDHVAELTEESRRVHWRYPTHKELEMERLLVKAAAHPMLARVEVRRWLAENGSCRCRGVMYPWQHEPECWMSQP